MAASPLPSREKIVQCLKEANKALHAGAIGKRCGVTKNSYGPLLELLDSLAVEGTLRRGSGNRFSLPKHRSQKESWSGSYSGTPRGFGFVNCAGKPDVYVKAENSAGALHGDTVTVEVLAIGGKGVEGVITEIKERRNPRVSGVVRVQKASAWLEPDDDRIRGPIILHDGFEECEGGEAAVARLTRFPETPDENPEGRLVAVLGVPGEALVEVAKIKVREQIEEEHPPEAMREAEAIAVRARKLELGNRKDLRNIPFLTIDPADARDHDDAVYAEKTEKGFRVYVAIADVAEYVQPDSALDKEAKHRGCTIYLPDRAIPMLPGALAADLCSLLPERERYCMCVIADLDADAKVKRTRVVEGLMRAAAMITYDGAAHTLKFTDKGAPSPQAEAFKADLRVLASIAGKLRRARLKRGALDLNVPEPKLELDPTSGVPLNITQRAVDPGIKRAYQLVEEMMLLANECVARWLLRHKSPAVFRVHGAPDEEKLMRLCRIADALGINLDPDDLSSPLGVSRWLKRIQKHERRNVMEVLLLRSLKQAVYDVVNIGHFGLASDAYLHFTSPIRRYPDLLVHRTLKGLLRGAKPDNSPEAIEKLRDAATQSSNRERAAIKVEREVMDLYRALFMRDHLGELYEGNVTAIVGGGIFVAINDPFVEVMIRFEGLGPDHYDITEDELSLVGVRSGDRISLGDVVMLEIDDVSLLRRQVYGHRVVYKAHETFRVPRHERTAIRRERRRKHERPAGKKPRTGQARRVREGESGWQSSPKRSKSQRGSAPRKKGRKR